MSGLTIRFLSREDVVRAGGENMAMVIEAVEEALRLHARGETVLPSKSVLRWGPPESELTTGRINVMPAYVGGSVRMAGIKWIGSNPANLGVGLPRATGLIVLSEVDHKLPVAVMDGTLISAMRTGAVSGVAAKYLVREDARRVGLIGAGVQARTQLWALKTVRPALSEVAIYDLDRGRAEAMAGEVGARFGVEAAAVAGPEEAVRGADVVVTATTASQPVVRSGWVAEGACVIQIAGYEVDDETVLAADKVVVDDWTEVVHRGISTVARLHLAARFPRERLHAELGQIVTGEREGRASRQERIYFNAVGMAIEDVAVAARVYQTARAQGIGRDLALWEAAEGRLPAG